MNVEHVQENYENGMRRFESDFVDGVPHGVQHHWHPNGVMSMEIPFDHGVMDGVVRQWNEKGELIESSLIQKGTGIHRLRYPNGILMIEISYLDGAWAGRQRSFDEDGVSVGEAYWLNNKRISKRKYDSECEKNPKLPRYSKEEIMDRVSNDEFKKTSPSKLTAGEDDKQLKELLRGPAVREALEWLKDAKNSVGEASTHEDSYDLVSELYLHGAKKVYAIDIQHDKTTKEENTGVLIVELPRELSVRSKLFRHLGDLAEERGFDPDEDAGQKYVLLMLD